MNPQVKLEVGPLFRKNLNTSKNIVIHVGGTRAGKTFSILLYLFYLSMTVKNLKILITRKTGPSLRLTVYRDFTELLVLTQTTSYYEWNKTERSFTNLITGSFIIFVPIDEIEKVKGSQFNYIFMNEANQFTLEEFQFLKLRLSAPREDNRPNQIILDLNPSDYYGWVREYTEKYRDEIDLIKSNFRDNPFLDKNYKEMILKLREENLHLWKIYGLGEWDKPEHLVYTNWDVITDELFDRITSEWEAYGLDWGYNSPTALVYVKIRDKVIYVKELIYQTKLLVSEFVELIETMGISKEIPIYVDPSEPALIKYLQERGFWAEGGNRNVKEGIRELQMCQILITESSVNLIDEIRNYSFQTKDDKILDEPVKWKDHALDALRYAYYTHKEQNKTQVVWFIKN